MHIRRKKHTSPQEPVLVAPPPSSGACSVSSLANRRYGTFHVVLLYISLVGKNVRERSTTKCSTFSTVEAGVSACFRQGSMMSASLLGMQILEMGSWVTANRSDMNPSNISSAKWIWKWKKEINKMPCESQSLSLLLTPNWYCIHFIHLFSVQY